MFTISLLLWFYENLNSNTAGPAGWFASQILVLLYHHLDNLNNTCGLSFNFENDKDEPSRTSSKTSRDSEPEVVVVETRVAKLGSLSSGAKMAMKIFVKHVFTIFASNVSFFRVIANLQN